MLRPAVWVDAASYSDSNVLRAVVVVAGLGWAAAFIAVGLGYDLQMYGDGAMFSYAVAVQDAWAIHWHNISGRLFVYLICFVPAEIVVEITRSAHSGIVVYGLLLFGAPLAGLAATWAAIPAKARAAPSVAMWPASPSKAREFANQPAAASAPAKPRVRAQPSQ